MQGAWKPFNWVMVRHGVAGFDVGKVLYDTWLRWSRKHGAPVDYIVMDGSSGTPLTSAQMNEVV